MNYSRIPEELKKQKQWVCTWDSSKIPMKAFERGAASSTNPNTWATFEQAEEAVKRNNYDHIGYVFNNTNLVGIDIDFGFENGLMTPLCADIMQACRSYTEKSKSGRGVHILVHGSLPFSGKNNLAGVEIYQDRRFFIMTGKILIFPTIIGNQKAIDYIVDQYFKETERRGSTSPLVQRIYSPEYSKPVKGKIQIEPHYPNIPDGCRNISLTSLAGSWHNIGYNRTQIYKELQKVNGTVCQPPLPNQEIQNIVESITKYRR